MNDATNSGWSPSKGEILNHAALQVIARVLQGKKASRFFKALNRFYFVFAA